MPNYLPQSRPVECKGTLGKDGSSSEGYAAHWAKIIIRPLLHKQSICRPDSTLQHHPSEELTLSKRPYLPYQRRKHGADAAIKLNLVGRFGSANMRR
jgi:hypothetical protein